MEKIILASESPRRAALLRLIGVPFVAVPSEVPESESLPLDPVEHVLELSRRKAENVARKIQGGLVLGADTIVVLDGEILGKPGKEEEAAAMLSKLAGRTHQVFTGLTLVNAEGGRSLSDFVCTSVRMRPISKGGIERYVASGEPLDKAGAYGIQGRGALFIESIEGCFYNVVGLPLAKLAEMMGKMGCDLW